MAAQDDVLQQDLNFVRPYINDNTNFTGLQKTTLADILNRAAGMNGRRGGLTKQMLLDLAPLLSGENNLRHADSKAVIIAGLLQMVARLPETQDPPENVGGGDQVLGDAEQQDQQQVPPALPREDIPAGWEQFIPVDPAVESCNSLGLIRPELKKEVEPSICLHYCIRIPSCTRGTKPNRPGGTERRHPGGLNYLANVLSDYV